MKIAGKQTKNCEKKHVNKKIRNIKTNQRLLFLFIYENVYTICYEYENKEHHFDVDKTKTNINTN